jgi:hypothetical protein
MEATGLSGARRHKQCLKSLNNNQQASSCGCKQDASNFSFKVPWHDDIYVNEHSLANVTSIFAQRQDPVLTLFELYM